MTACRDAEARRGFEGCEGLAPAKLPHWQDGGSADKGLDFIFQSLAPMVPAGGFSRWVACAGGSWSFFYWEAARSRPKIASRITTMTASTSTSMATIATQQT